MSDFSSQCLRWYRQHARDLPWRNTRDPYAIWISEVMLQQTTVKAVIPYYHRWLKRYPTIQKLANAPLQDVLKHWQGLGYYQRARNLHKAAQRICVEHNGRIPDNEQALQKLPGFGPYTVAAVLSIAYQKKVPLVDGNVRRVLMRILSIKGQAVAKHDAAILGYLGERLPQRGIHLFNQSLMELGALVCRKKLPLCNQCPLTRYCRAFQEGTQELIPEPKSLKLETINAAIAVIERKGRFLLQQRPEKGLLAGLWEFPGGKIKSGEKPEEAVKRELREELKVEGKIVRKIGKVRHYYTQFAVNLHVFACTVRPVPQSGEKRKWLSKKTMASFPMPSGSAQIVDKLL